MTETTLGTIRGTDASGMVRTFAVSKATHGYTIIMASLERRVFDSGAISQLVDEVKSAYQLAEAEFIPAHGAHGAKASELS
jgi:hypothetical protein